MEKKNLFEDEIKNSETYRIIKETTRRVKNDVQSQVQQTLRERWGVGAAQQQAPQQTVETTARDVTGDQTVTQAPPPAPMAQQAPAEAVPAKKKKKSKKKEEVPEGMKAVHKKSVVPFYAIAGTVLGYALFFPLYSVAHFLILASLAAIVGFTCFKFCKGKTVYEPIGEDEAKEGKKSRTGFADVDQMLEEGERYIEQLNLANDMIEDETVSAQIDRMAEVSGKIFEYVEAQPQKAGQIRKFMNYYLPTTLKLLNSYFMLKKQGVDGKNITDSIVEIERILQTIVKVYEKQLDALFQDEALDISTDVAVLENMMEQETFKS